MIPRPLPKARPLPPPPRPLVAAPARQGDKKRQCVASVDTASTSVVVTKEDVKRGSTDRKEEEKEKKKKKLVSLPLSSTRQAPTSGSIATRSDADDTAILGSTKRPNESTPSATLKKSKVATPAVPPVATTSSLLPRPRPSVSERLFPQSTLPLPGKRGHPLLCPPAKKTVAPLDISKSTGDSKDDKSSASTHRAVSGKHKMSQVRDDGGGGGSVGDSNDYAHTGSVSSTAGTKMRKTDSGSLAESRVTSAAAAVTVASSRVSVRMRPRHSGNVAGDSLGRYLSLPVWITSKQEKRHTTRIYYAVQMLWSVPPPPSFPSRFRSLLSQWHKVSRVVTTTPSPVAEKKKQKSKIKRSILDILFDYFERKCVAVDQADMNNNDDSKREMLGTDIETLVAMAGEIWASTDEQAVSLHVKTLLDLTLSFGMVTKADSVNVWADSILHGLESTAAALKKHKSEECSNRSTRTRLCCLLDTLLLISGTGHGTCVPPLGLHFSQDRIDEIQRRFQSIREADLCLVSDDIKQQLAHLQDFFHGLKPCLLPSPISAVATTTHERSMATSSNSVVETVEVGPWVAAPLQPPVATMKRTDQHVPVSSGSLSAAATTLSEENKEPPPAVPARSVSSTMGSVETSVASSTSSTCAAPAVTTATDYPSTTMSVHPSYSEVVPLPAPLGIDLVDPTATFDLGPMEGLMSLHDIGSLSPLPLDVRNIPSPPTSPPRGPQLGSLSPPHSLPPVDLGSSSTVATTAAVATSNWGIVGRVTYPPTSGGRFVPLPPSNPLGIPQTSPVPPPPHPSSTSSFSHSVPTVAHGPSSLSYMSFPPPPLPPPPSSQTAWTSPHAHPSWIGHPAAVSSQFSHRLHGSPFYPPYSVSSRSSYSEGMNDPMFSGYVDMGSIPYTSPAHPPPPPSSIPWEAPILIIPNPSALPFRPRPSSSRGPPSQLAAPIVTANIAAGEFNVPTGSGVRLSTVNRPRVPRRLTDNNL